MKKKKGLLVFSDGFSGLSVAEISDEMKNERRRIKAKRRYRTHEKEGLSSRESRYAVACPSCGSTDYIRYGKTPQGIQRFQCRSCGKIYVISGGKNLFSAKLCASELIQLFECIYLGLPIRSICIITGLVAKTVTLWQKRAFHIAEKWVNEAKFEGKTWIDEVYFNFSNENGTITDSHKKAGLSFGTLCVCIGYDQKGTMFCRLMKAGKADSLSIECCFHGRMDKVTLLVHDADKSHRGMVKSEGLKDLVVKSYPKTAESLKEMAPINNYSALLVNEMRKHPGTKVSHLNERLCFISYKAWLSTRHGLEQASEILLSEVIKSKKEVKSEKYDEKSQTK